MKLLGFNCSVHKGRTTFQALEACFAAAKAERPGLETEIIELAELDFDGCGACWSCRKNKLVCAVQDDFAQLIPRIADAAVAGIVIATPVYMGSMSWLCKKFIDRTLVFRTGGFALQNRLGGVIAVGGSRNGGQEITIQAIHAAFLIHDMVVVGDGADASHFGGALWNQGRRGIGEDEVGLNTARNLGKRMAQVTARLANSK